jgi:transposase
VTLRKEIEGPLPAPVQEKLMSYRIAGIDVHKKILAVVVSDLGNEGLQVLEQKKYSATPEQMRALAVWLAGLEVEEVVMESTAQYWRPVWGALEQYWQPQRQSREGAGTHAGKLHLAQAHSNRARHGRKNDLDDAERLIRRLVAHELVLSFVPDAGQRLRRTVTRRRTQLITDKTRLQNHLEDLLEQAHIKLSSLVSDLLGVSARRMLQAIVQGESDPAALAALADRNLRATSEQLCDALSACRTLNPVFRTLIGGVLKQLRLLEEQVEELDQLAAELMQADQQAVKRLSKVPGIQPTSAAQIIAEAGANAATFPSAAEFASWVGVTPGQNITAENNKSSHSPKGNRPLRRVLNEIAHAAVKTKGSIFELKFNHFKRAKKYQEAIWALAHFMCKVIWNILHLGVEYEERGPGVAEKAHKKRTQKMIRHLKRLGYHIELPITQEAHMA